MSYCFPYIFSFHFYFAISETRHLFIDLKARPYPLFQWRIRGSDSYPSACTYYVWNKGTKTILPRISQRTRRWSRDRGCQTYVACTKCRDTSAYGRASKLQLPAATNKTAGGGMTAASLCPSRSRNPDHNDNTSNATKKNQNFNWNCYRWTYNKEGYLQTSFNW
jgi:hypothetical protein